MEASNKDELYDQSHCAVCFKSYNEVDRKPKFLSCHHYFCLACIKFFARKKITSIPCPSCRKETVCALGQEGNLTTNKCALNLLAFIKKADEPPKPNLPSNDQKWCFKCMKKATGASCCIEHPSSIASMGSQSPEFCLQIHKQMSDHCTELYWMIRNWDLASRDGVSVASSVLDKGIEALREADQHIKHHNQRLKALRESVRQIPKNADASSLAKRMDEIGSEITKEKKLVESMKDAPSALLLKAIKFAQIVGAALLLFKKEKLNKEEMEVLEKIERDVDGHDLLREE